MSAADWVTAAIDAGLDVVAITDHDSADMIAEIQADPRVVAGDLVVFPGVEVTSSEGVHLLILLDRNATADDAKALLGACGVPSQQWGTGEARATRTFEKCMEIATKSHGALCIAPHADAHPTEGNSCKASLLVGVKDNSNLESALSSPFLAAAEVCGDDEAKHAKLRGLGSGRMEPGLSLLRFSDAHTTSEIGRRSTWIKMTEPNLGGLRLAFTDGARSTRQHSEDARHPNQPPGLAVESLEISDAKHVGRSEPLSLSLNPWLNALIGGRGAGKSSLVELMRLALGRSEGLPSSVKETHESFAKVYRARSDPGALTPDTLVSLLYRKDGARFKATWSPEKASPALEELHEDGWKAAEGTVRRRLPVQIYSQNEINEVAKDPRALLGIVNESSEVDHDKWSASFASDLASYLALRAQARDLDTHLAIEGEARGELADVSRQIQAFEGTEHDKVLGEHQRFQKQERAVERWEEGAKGIVDDLRRHASDLSMEPLAADLFDSSKSADKSILDSVRPVEDEIAKAASALKTAADALDAEIQQARKSINGSDWSSARDSNALAYESLSAQFNELELGEAGVFDALLEKRQSLEEQLAELDEIKKQRDAARDEAEKALSRLEEARLDLSERRRTFLAKVLDGNPLVRVRMNKMADRDDALESLRELLGVGESFGDDIDTIVGRIFDSQESTADGLKDAKEILRALADGEESNYQARDQRFVSRIRKLPPETIDRLEAWFPEDLLNAEFSRTNSDEFEPIERGSTGQQNAAILAFLLSYGDEPIIIDQPENDLDNRLISDLVVGSLIESKKRRQLIVVTHNPNLVVNGDAEFVVSLDIPRGEVKLEAAGGLQEESVREEVCEVMEGGRQAFELRYSRIGKKSTI